MKRFLAAGILLFAVISSYALASTPSAERLLDQARRNMTPVKDYAVDLRMDLTGGQVVIKGMTMTLYFKKPNRTRIVATQGFAATPTSVTLGDALSELTKHCRPKLVKTAKKNGIDCYVIRLDPVRQGSQPPALLWLDKAHLLVRAIRIDGPCPMKSEWRYARVDEKYDLPRRIQAEVTVPRAAGFQGNDPDERPRRKGARASGPGLGSGTQTMRATLTFSNYRVNKGIPDSVFTSKDPPRR